MLLSNEMRRFSGFTRSVPVRWLVCCLLVGPWTPRAEVPAITHYKGSVQPILTKYCSDCHGDGAKKGGVAFDEFKSDDDVLGKRELWNDVLKYVRAGMMPPHEKKTRPSDAEKQTLEKWIKLDVFAIDPANPDPGRVTVRRLNRTEYHNTIRDLMGVDFNADLNFPADDTGHGFDNIGDVLNLSPMLLEKYLAAAKSIVDEAVPKVPKVMPEAVLNGNKFKAGETKLASGRGPLQGTVTLPFYEAVTISNRFSAQHNGSYKVGLDFTVRGNSGERGFDSNKCTVVFLADGQELLHKEYGWFEKRDFHFDFDVQWGTGQRDLVFSLEPKEPLVPKMSAIEVRLASVTISGPKEKEHWTKPKNYARFFGTNASPVTAGQKRERARQLLDSFATKAFRRPVDRPTVDRLTTLAAAIYDQPGKTFEAGVAHAMVAVLASPRFIFREENIQNPGSASQYALVDEYALASRLSYFFWSSMPDEELIKLAREGKLRRELPAQVKRLLADSRSEAFLKNFPGQWLQARDIETVVVDARSILAREEAPDPAMEKVRARFRELRNRSEETLTDAEKEELKKIRTEFFRSFSRGVRADLTGEIRTAMRRETEMLFQHVLREDRPMTELLDSDYTFLNEKLAKHYGITNVLGDEMRLVKLAANSPRGGILTHGTVLAVTSNPTRTSPVKRGLFILDNILGTPPAPPPPDIPPLEEAGKGKERTLTLRETLELHRSKPLCSSCHNRMDPLGLAFENFNAMGMWREKERTQAIEPSGMLITGEKFTTVQELKHILVTERKVDFYRCVTEKLLTYALGRGLEYFDVETVDQIVESLKKTDGKPSALIMGIVESAPFQKRRNADTKEPRKLTQNERN